MVTYLVRICTWRGGSPVHIDLGQDRRSASVISQILVVREDFDKSRRERSVCGPLF